MSEFKQSSNVWYMNHYSGSPKEANYGRPFFLSKSLCELGVKCRVIAASYHHHLRCPVAIDEDFYSDLVEGVPYTWVKTPTYKGNGFSRLKNMFSFAWKLWKHDLVKEFGIEKPDVIIVSSPHPFHFFAGWKWARKYQAKLIFEVRDIWPLTLTALLGTHPLHPFILMLAGIEKMAHKYSDQVVSLLPNALLHMRTKGLAQHKFNYIPNGIYLNPTDELRPSSHRQYLESLKEKGAFICIYTGAHGIPNALENFVKAAEITEKMRGEEIQFILIGEGGEKKKLIEYVTTNQIKNVHLLDAIPRNEIPDTLSYADMVFSGLLNDPLFKLGISPNKVFEYMLASKSILMTLSSPNNPVELAEAGTCLGSNEPEKIAAEIIRYSRLPPEELAAIGKKGNDYVKAHHSYDILARKYMDVISK